jgi:predicted PurR-regulated permease PerM
MERVLLGLLLALLGYLAYLVFAPFLVPLTWAVALVIVFYPMHRRLEKRLLKPTLTALLSTLALTILIVAPSITVLSAVTAQTVRLVERVRGDWEDGRIPFDRVVHSLPVERALTWLSEHNVSEEQIHELVTKNVERVAGFIAAQTGRLAANIFFFLGDLFVMLLAAFYLFRDGPALLDRLRRVLPVDHVHREGIFYITYNVLYASVFSGIIVAVVQGALGGLAFWILGVSAPALWGLVMAFFALLPIVGPWLVWVPVMLAFLVEGAYGHALALLLLGAVVISGVDNVLRPILISGRAQMNALLVFISILGGVAAFGFLGIILGPIVVAVGEALIEVYSAGQPLSRGVEASG